MVFGLLNLNKPSGITSRRVVDRVQRLVKPAKVGHAGTLDPLASGVLVVGVGPATRLVEYVQEMHKHYRATFLLGRTSTTEDVEGEVTLLSGAAPPARGELEQAARELSGRIEQRPPSFSALNVSGQRAYKLARAGQEVKLAPRTVHVYRLEITGYDYPELRLEVECSGGTYVRSLGRDLAERAGTAAVMSGLVRTAIGPFTLADAIDPETLSAATLANHLLPPILAVRGRMVELSLSPAELARVAHGQTIALSGVQADRCAVVDAAGRLAAVIVRRSGDEFRAIKNFPSAER